MTHLPDGPWLNVGSGPQYSPGWVSIDGSWQAWFAGRPRLARLATRITGRDVGQWPVQTVYRDVRRGLGYGSASVAVVFSSHCLEHLYREEAAALLQEAHRVLKPGGVCRVVVPDLAAIVGWYLDARAEAGRPNGKPSSDLLMEMLGLRQARAARGGGLLDWYRRWTDLDSHKWMYDLEGLHSMFSEAGFADAKPRGYLDSAIPKERLIAVEAADRVENGAGICVEAIR